MKYPLVTVAVVALAATTPAPATPSVDGNWCGSAAGWEHVLILEIEGVTVSGWLEASTNNRAGNYPVSGEITESGLDMKVGAAKFIASIGGEALTGAYTPSVFTEGNPSSATYKRC